nr:sensor histidine kinase [Candidatus Thioglobus sp.]
TKINSLQDLRGKTFAAANPSGLGGWILGYDYLLSQGIDPNTDFSRIDFLGRQDNIVDAVNKKMIDAGVVRTGVLEKLSKAGKVRLSDIKVLDSKSGFPYILSTHLVPEWSFSATTKADPQLTTLIQKNILLHSVHMNDIEVDGKGRPVNVRKHKYHNIAKWGDVADYQVIHELLKRHRISVYKDPIAISFLKKYYQFLAFLLMLLVASIWYIRSERVKKINQYKVELERLSRVSSVDQLLSEIAHEIAQPVTSIKIDAKVIEKLLKDTDTMSDNSIDKVVDSLSQKTDHCVDVINNIRSFLSTKKIVHEPVDVNNRIANVLKLINHEISENKVSVNESLESELPLVYMSTVEFDQVLLNLCKNAISAMSGRKGKLKVLTISTVLVNNDVVITVKDTGNGVTDKENLFKLFKTNKALNSAEGLGLGLSLSRSITRSYDGDLTLDSSSSRGTAFMITLPITNEK